MRTIDDSVNVQVPVRTAYNQWTQFEDFPHFMKGVQEVRQLDDKRLRWRAEVWGKDLEWDSEITKQIPDRMIAWRSISGPDNGGFVEFTPISPTETKVNVHIEYEPEGLMENVGAAVGAASSRVHTELERYKDFLEKRGGETGAWRGEIDTGAPTIPGNR